MKVSVVVTILNEKEAIERLLRSLLLQVLFTIRSERLLMEQLEYNLLYRWFVGLGIDEEAMERNPSLDERVTHDLNHDPRLPFFDDRFENGNALFDQEGADLVDRGSTARHQPRAHAVQCLQVELILAFLPNKIQVGPQSSFGDGLGIVVVILLPLGEGLRVLCRDDARFKT